jgi:hypothetical protein
MSLEAATSISVLPWVSLLETNKKQGCVCPKPSSPEEMVDTDTKIPKIYE